MRKQLRDTLLFILICLLIYFSGVAGYRLGREVCRGFSFRGILNL